MIIFLVNNGGYAVHPLSVLSGEFSFSCYTESVENNSSVITAFFSAGSLLYGLFSSGKACYGLAREVWFELQSGED